MPTNIVAPTVKLHISGLTQFRADVKNPNSELTKKVTTLWESRYKAFIFRRFNTFSRGGGNWPPLSPETIERRRKGKGKGRVAILVDVGLMRAALEPGVARPGWQSKRNGFSIVVGFGGPAGHGDDSATIAEIASFHNAGLGVPKRVIIVQPPVEVVAGMKADATRLINKYGRDKTR